MNRFTLLLLLVSLLMLGSLGCSRGTKEVTDVPPEDQKALVRGNNAFAFDLYGRLSQREGNLVFSPYSISTALAMTYAGARGETAKQMASTLHFNLDPDRLHPAFASSLGQLRGGGESRPFNLYVANALWGQKGLAFRNEFLKVTRDQYLGGLKEVDFASDQESARQAINRWVEEQTRDKIKELLQPTDVSPQTRLVLTNALYFKAAWKWIFPKDGTVPAKFEVAPGKKIDVPMMHILDGNFEHFQGEDYQLLELPYKGDQLTMVVLLPTKRCGLAVLERSLTEVKVLEGLSKLKARKLMVALPRFKQTLNLRLREELSKMSMQVAFSEGADFSGIASGGGLRLREVVHKALVEVDEEGTTAAAATAVTVLEKAEVPPSFRVDHPFLFLIRDRHNSSILFVGRVVRPES